ncbi:MAG: undecaprenyldiphospho-muramoylpentapeptide beta-N-acetylglucosaminyltransferase [Terrimicrobiaceae bacterium]
MSQPASRPATGAFRVVIACGGTGGHLFPGLAVAEELKSRGHEVLLIVSEKAIDSLALQGHPDFRYEKLPSVGMPSPLSPAFLRFLRRTWESLGHCRSLYRRYRPAVVLGMGGFTSTAPLLAGRMQKLPTLIHESNAIPGRANLLAAKFVTRVLLGFADCRDRFPGRDCAVTGTPVRKDLGHRLPRGEALAKLRLREDAPTLLVMGGSQGASGINRALFKAAPLLKAGSVQIIHLTGERDDRLAAANYQRENIPHYVAPFHHRMEELYSAADLVVSRAGAASLSELSHFGLPSILIPYPFAADDHQTANAKIFAAAGAAGIQIESEIVPETFAALASNLLNDPQRREAMARAASAILPTAAAANVADEVGRVVEEAARATQGGGK